MIDDDAVMEREKYARMYATGGYEVDSPAMRALPQFLNRLEPCRVLDLGCGTGEVVQRLNEAGFSAVGIDITTAAFRGEKLTAGTAWRLPFVDDAFDCAFSCDVLEHLPEHRMEKAIDELARVARSAYLEIATIPDSCGRLIGETLHLTVQPPTWWLALLSKRFRIGWWEERTRIMGLRVFCER